MACSRCVCLLGVDMILDAFLMLLQIKLLITKTVLQTSAYKQALLINAAEQGFLKCFCPGSWRVHV